MDAETLVAAVRALEALAHERTIAKLKQDMDEILVPSDQSSEDLCVLPYDPAAVFLLEMMVSIARQASPHLEDLWYEIITVKLLFLEQ